LPAATADSLQTLRSRLLLRRREIEEAALARVKSVGASVEVADPAYVLGLGETLAVALDYALDLIEPEPLAETAPPLPVVLLARARLAARHGVGLETLLRRYAAGYALLCDVLLDEAQRCRVDPETLRHLLRRQSKAFDAILASVAEEYAREGRFRPPGSEPERLELIRRLLDAEPLDASRLNYPLGVHHMALVASGDSALEAFGRLGKHLDRRLLLVEADAQLAWGWLGGRRPFTGEELDHILTFPWPGGTDVACGEAGEGQAGWRLSHRQARAALAVARRGSQSMVRYSDVALVAATLHDDLLATSLRRAYLVPIESDPNRGARSKVTLRAYFAAAGNISSAAATLGVNRRTVAGRLAAVEKRLGRPLCDVAPELEVALRLDDLEGAAHFDGS
jgi:hypothetical protein